MAESNGLANFRINPVTGKIEMVDTVNDSLSNSIMGDYAKGTISKDIDYASNITGIDTPDILATNYLPSVDIDSGGIMKYLNDNKEGLGTLAGLASTGMNLYSNLFGNSNDLFKEQIGMLKDQRAYNAESAQKKRDFEDTWAKASNASSGLAGSGTKVS